MCEASCYNCRRAKMTPYSPATQWEPEELPVPEDCYLNKSSVFETPEEDCAEWEEREDDYEEDY